MSESEHPETECGVEPTDVATSESSRSLFAVFVELSAVIGFVLFALGYFSLTRQLRDVGVTPKELGISLEIVVLGVAGLVAVMLLIPTFLGAAALVLFAKKYPRVRRAIVGAPDLRPAAVIRKETGRELALGIVCVGLLLFLRAADTKASLDPYPNLPVVRGLLFNPTVVKVEMSGSDSKFDGVHCGLLLGSNDGVTVLAVRTRNDSEEPTRVLRAPSDRLVLSSTPRETCPRPG